jgi:hypothetical protein
MLMLMTLAGLGFTGTPATGKPAAQRIESTKSSRVIPQGPKTRIGKIKALGFTPHISWWPLPATMLETSVPWVLNDDETKRVPQLASFGDGA